MNRILLLTCVIGSLLAGVAQANSNAVGLAAAMIRQNEGFRAVAYRDVGGHWAVGYGSSATPGQVMHMKAVNDADLKRPIILDEDGELMDGRHRLMKAMLLGKKTIKAVRFDENPSPCQVEAV